MIADDVCTLRITRGRARARAPASSNMAILRRALFRPFFITWELLTDNGANRVNSRPSFRRIDARARARSVTVFLSLLFFLTFHLSVFASHAILARYLFLSLSLSRRLSLYVSA